MMTTSMEITAAAFAAHLRCPTKGWLVRAGEAPSDEFWVAIRARVADAYKAKVAADRTIAIADFALTVDAESATCNGKNPPSPTLDSTTDAPDRRAEVVPHFYSPWEGINKSDDLLLAFAALAVGLASGSSIPTVGRIVRGDQFRSKRVDIVPLLPKARTALETITALGELPVPPNPVLNQHCPACEYQSRCRGIALERDDLSLLGAITAKERAKFAEKGITTITQLSYGYRPRRQRRPKSTPRRTTLQFRHDHKLKALALKKGRIHIIGSPSFPTDGTPVFIDVEGAPDRDFYYLIGLRYRGTAETAQFFFWADSPDDEGVMWRQCLDSLRQLDDPRLFHYGAYESRFLKQMKERWPPTEADASFVDRLIERAVNILGVIYGRVYFPTYTNGLKEVARWLGFEWRWSHASGHAAILVRRCWELTGDEVLKRKLIAYNADDCRAAEVVTEALVRLGGGEDKGAGFDAVDVGSLEVPFQRTFGKLQSVLPEFEKINAAAYWNYQRSRVYVRTDRIVAKSLRKARASSAAIFINEEVTVQDRPEACPKCGSTKLWSFGEMMVTVYDLKFTKGGIRRWMVRYRYRRHRCGNCRAEMTIFFRKSKYGPKLRAYVIYLVIELRMSRQKISEHLAQVFGIHILPGVIQDMKAEAAKLYEPTYRSILRQIAGGHLVHADETKGVVYGGGHYVWIFTNLTSVAYVYSPWGAAALRLFAGSRPSRLPFPADAGSPRVFPSPTTVRLESMLDSKLGGRISLLCPWLKGELGS